MAIMLDNFRREEKYYVTERDFHLGLRREDGTVAVEHEWEDINLFDISEGFAPVSRNEKWGFVNIKTGKVIRPFYDEVKPFKDGYAPIKLFERWGIIDTTGNVVVQPIYTTSFYFPDDFAIVQFGGKLAKDEDGNEIVINSDWRLINKRGYEITGGCDKIVRLKKNMFRFYSEKCNSIREFFPYSDFIVILDDDFERTVIDYRGNPTQDYTKKLALA